MTARQVEIVPALHEHIDHIDRHARPADRDELWAASRETPAQCLRRGLQVSRIACTAMLEGEPIAMFGVSPVSILGGIGTPWMVGTEAMDQLRVQKALLRHSSRLIGVFREEFPGALFNTVDKRNEAAMRWLAWLGFSFGPEYPVGPDSIPFVLFYWRP